jgi:hypothetical protein
MWEIIVFASGTTYVGFKPNHIAELVYLDVLLITDRGGVSLGMCGWGNSLPSGTTRIAV